MIKTPNVGIPSERLVGAHRRDAKIGQTTIADKSYTTLVRF